jgi:hypothetical protein
VVPPQLQTKVRAWEAFFNGPLACVDLHQTVVEHAKYHVVCICREKMNFALRIARFQYRGLSADNF